MNDMEEEIDRIHRCQPSRNRAGNPANLVVSRIPAFFSKTSRIFKLFWGRKKSPKFTIIFAAKKIFCAKF